MGAYIAAHKSAVAQEYGVNPWWAGAFNAVSAFNNGGMSLIDASMVPFARNYYMLLTNTHCCQEYTGFVSLLLSTIKRTEIKS